MSTDNLDIVKRQMAAKENGQVKFGETIGMWECTMETERLFIRRITRKDMDALLAIMKKPEVMYAWEHGFTKKDVCKWINRQLTRYCEDGFGYFAVVLKECGTLIGQAGLMKSIINGNETVELGYILDNTYWHNGYGTEAARACLEYAYGELELNTVCCSIRPENVDPSGWQKGWE